MVIKVVATETIDPGDRVTVDRGLVRKAHVGADRDAGTSHDHINRGELGNWNEVTRELRRVPAQRRS